MHLNGWLIYPILFACKICSFSFVGQSPFTLALSLSECFVGAMFVCSDATYDLSRKRHNMLDVLFGNLKIRFCAIITIYRMIMDFIESFDFLTMITFG